MGYIYKNIIKCKLYFKSSNGQECQMGVKCIRNSKTIFSGTRLETKQMFFTF